MPLVRAHCPGDRTRSRGACLRAAGRSRGAHARGSAAVRLILLLAVLVGSFAVPAVADAANPWLQVGGDLNLVTSTNATDQAMTVEGTTPYVAWVEGGNLYMKHWTGATWLQDGGQINATAGATVRVDIATDGTDEYVAWNEMVAGKKNVFVKRWNGAAYVAMGGSLNISAARDAEDVNVELVNNVPSVTWIEDTAGTNDVNLKQWSAGTWNAIGGFVDEAQTDWVGTPAVTGNAANLYVAFREYNGSSYDVIARRWTGAAWATVGGAGTRLDATTEWVYETHATMQGANLVVGWSEDSPGVTCDCRIYAKQWNGAAWSLIGGIVNDDHGAYNAGFDMVPGVSGPWISYRRTESISYRIVAANWTGAAWKHFGVLNARNTSAQLPGIGLVSGTPWVSYIEQDAANVSQVDVVKWSPTYTMVGDISGLIDTPSANRVDFSWTNPADPNYNGVDIYRSSVAGAIGVLRTTVNAPGNTWADTTVVNGTTYWFTFVAHDTLGNRRETAYETADSDITFARYGSAIATNGTKVWLVGGYSNAASAYANDIWEFDPATTVTTKKTATTSTPRYRLGGVWVGGAVNRMILMGGFDGAVLTSIQKYDPAGDVMTTPAATLPAARQEGMVVYAPNTGLVYYMGGSDGTNATTTIYSYNPVSNVVATVGVSLPQALYRAAAAYWPADGCIYLVGGQSPIGTDINKIVKFCPAAGTVTTLVQTLPAVGSEIMANVTDDGILLEGGSNATYQQTIYELHPTEKVVMQHAFSLPRPEVNQSPPTMINEVGYSAASWRESNKVTQVNPGPIVDVTPSNAPNTPTNTAPANNAAVATTTPTLSASAFSDPDAGDTHSASQWQVRTAAGGYGTPAFDSGLDFTNKVSIVSGLLGEGQYCFHVRYRDNHRVFSAYSAETCFTVDTVPDNPNSPVSLAQLRNDAVTPIPTAAWTTDGILNNVTFTFTMSDPDASQTLTPWVELRPNATGFSGVCGTAVGGIVKAGGGVAATTGGAGVTGTVTFTGLVSGTQYHWRACVRDATARSSGWVAMGSSPDFGVVNNANPTSPALVSPGAAAATTDTTPDLVATFGDPDAGQTGTVAFEVCTAAFTPGQSCAAAGGTLSASGTSGSVAIGANGTWTVTPALANGSYFWRAMGTDQYGFTSAWTASRALTIGVPTMTVTTDVASLNLGSAAGGTSAFGTFTASISTNSAGGYQLVARDTSDTIAANQPAVDTIADWTGSDAVPSVWPAATSGFGGITVRDATGGRLAKWGAGTGTPEADVVNNKYAGLDLTTDVQLHQRPTFNLATDTVVATVRLAPGAATRPGPYQMVVTVTGVGLP